MAALQMAALTAEEQEVLTALQDAGVPDPESFSDFLADLHASYYRTPGKFQRATRAGLENAGLPAALVDCVIACQAGALDDLPRIPKDHPVMQLVRELNSQMDMLLSHHAGCNAGDSQTALGEAVLSKAQTRRLFEVTGVHQAQRDDWLANASVQATREWQATQRPGSQLEEAVLQTAMANMFRAVSFECPMTFHDTHKAPSVCGPWKPDFVACTPGPRLPVNTTFILELKAQTAQYYTPAHVQQVVTYAYALMEKLPTHCRSRVYTGLTDLKTMVLIMVERAAGGGWTYTLDDLRDQDVLSVLCAVMMNPVAELGAAPLPALRLVSNPTHTLQICSWLGSGATAEVFSVSQAGTSAEAAAKVMRYKQGAALQMLDQEDRILRQLHEQSEQQLSSFLAIPRCLGQLQGEREDQGVRGLLLQPVGLVLRHETLQQLQGPGLAVAVQCVVDALKASHDLGTVHCDVRPDNLLIAPGSPVAAATQPCLYLSDWGCSRNCDTVLPAAKYCGTTKFASNAVLRALSHGESVNVKPEDDLESLVKSFFFLSRGQMETAALSTMGKQQYGELLELWQAQLLRRPKWSSIIAAARQKDYDAVAQALAEILE